MRRSVLPGPPVLPVLPGPCGPAGPFGPAGIWPARKSALRSEPFRTFKELTELGLSWSAPTLFLGITIETAATLVPASATRAVSQPISIGS
jgi:hypothetical protein